MAISEHRLIDGGTRRTKCCEVARSGGVDTNMSCYVVWIEEQDFVGLVDVGICRGMHSTFYTLGSHPHSLTCPALLTN